MYLQTFFGKKYYRFCFIFSEWAELNHRDSSSGSEIIESGSGSAEVAMDTGNPWDSKPLAASTIAPFDNPFDSPAKSGSNLDEGKIYIIYRVMHK